MQLERALRILLPDGHEDKLERGKPTAKDPEGALPNFSSSLLGERVDRILIAKGTRKLSRQEWASIKAESAELAQLKLGGKHRKRAANEDEEIDC